MRSRKVVVTLVSVFLLNAALATALPSFKIKPDHVSVSGLSSGAFMAVQFEIANSDLVQGAGVFAGGIFGCAQGSAITALTTCMNSPDQITVSDYIKKVDSLFSAGEIADPKNLQSHHIYLLSGRLDSTIEPTAGKKLLEFYRHFTKEDHIETEFKLKAEHGLPTLGYGSACAEGGSPWILNCGFDGAGAALKTLLGTLSEKMPQRTERLFKFNQKAFAYDNSDMDADGYIYIPTDCVGQDKACSLHVVFHGCRQGPEFLDDTFALHAGFNEWAEANRTVVLYPSILSSLQNPQGCWDWWGYTGSHYLSRTAPQIQTTRKIIERFIE